MAARGTPESRETMARFILVASGCSIVMPEGMPGWQTSALLRAMTVVGKHQTGVVGSSYVRYRRPAGELSSGTVGWVHIVPSTLCWWDTKAQFQELELPSRSWKSIYISTPNGKCSVPSWSPETSCVPSSVSTITYLCLVANPISFSLRPLLCSSPSSF